MLTTRQRKILSTLVVISVLSFALCAALETGYEHPIQTSDGDGNVLGFNNPITVGLYFILLRSASPTGILRYLGWYGGFYLLFHLIALVFFSVNPRLKPERAVAFGFFLQPLIFPFGLIGVLVLPYFVGDFFVGKIDGEALQDFPPTLILQSLWLIISITAGILILQNRKTAHSELSQ